MILKSFFTYGVILCIKAINPSSSVIILYIVPGVMSYTLGLRPRVAPHHTRYNIQYADRAGRVYCFYTKSYTIGERRFQNLSAESLLCFSMPILAHVAQGCSP